MALVEEPMPEPTSMGVSETERSCPDDQEIISRGFSPKLLPSPPAPKIRSLSTSEKNLFKSVFQNTTNYDKVKITDTLGAGGRTWTTGTPPLYLIHVGSAYSSQTANERKLLLIHEK